MASRDARWVLLTLLALAAVMSGCGRSRPTGDLSQLEIVRYRLNVDDRQGVARVVAEIRNLGESTVKEAAVKAQLLGPGDDVYEAGTTVVKRISPDETKVFSIVIKARGRERDVEFSIVAPEDLERADVEGAS